MGLTREFLSGIGVDMDDAMFQAFGEHFDATLHERVIDHVVHTLNDEQVHELADLRQSDSDQVWQWLQANVPNLSEIVRQEVDAALSDVVRSSDDL